MTKLKSIEKQQSNLIKSFESSNGITRRRVDTEQIWVDKSENIADAVIRKRAWKFGVLTFDFLQVFNNDVSQLPNNTFTGFKQTK